jgi:hypothetical protein
MLSVLQACLFSPFLLSLSLGQCVVTVVGPVSIEGSPATSQQLVAPYGATVDSINGGYLITDLNGHTVRRVWSNGTMTTVVGRYRIAGSAIDGPTSNATLLNSPAGIVEDGSGGFYFCDRANHVVRRFYANGTMIIVAGNTTARFTPGDGPGTSATLNVPSMLSRDPSRGTLWIVEQSK